MTEAIIYHVGKIDSTVKEDELRRLFSPFGKILRLQISRQNPLYQSQGICLLKFNPIGFSKELETNSPSLRGTKLVLRRLSAKDTISNEKIMKGMWITKMSKSTTVESLFKILGTFGNLIKLILWYWPETNSHRDLAFALFQDSQDAYEKIGENGIYIDGKLIEIRLIMFTESEILAHYKDVNIKMIEYTSVNKADDNDTKLIDMPKMETRKSDSQSFELIPSLLKRRWFRPLLVVMDRRTEFRLNFAMKKGRIFKAEKNLLKFFRPSYRMPLYKESLIGGSLEQLSKLFYKKLGEDNTKVNIGLEAIKKMSSIKQFRKEINFLAR